MVIVDVHIVDVQNGHIESNQDVVIADGRIRTILEHRSDRNYTVAEAIDGSSKYLIPGLWDMHTHTWWNFEHSFPLLLANGVTGIRDMFGHIEPCLNLREQISKGQVAGPDMYFSGPIIEGAEGRKFSIHYDQPENPAHAKEIVRRQKREGADFVKVYSALDFGAYQAIAEESSAIGIPLTGHIPNPVTLQEAVNAGQRSIEHLYGLIEYCSSRSAYFFDVLKGRKTDTLLTGKDGHTNRMKFATTTFDAEKVPSLIELLKGKNVWICPTLVTNKQYLQVPDEEIHEGESVHFLPDYITSAWDQRGSAKLEHRIKIGYFEVLEQYHQLSLDVIRALNAHGVNFLAGSDYLNPYCIPGFSLHDELQLFVDEAGFSPLEALQTATINPAQYFEMEADYGLVEEGKIANLVLLSANPIEDISNSRSITNVLLRGAHHPAVELQAAIRTIAEENKRPNIWEHIKAVIESDGFDEAVEQYRKLRSDQAEHYNFNREQLIDLGYALLDEGKTEVAIRVLEWNTQLFPEYWSAFDSLGDGYAAAGDEEKAQAAWKKAIELGSIVTRSKMKSDEE